MGPRDPVLCEVCYNRWCVPLSHRRDWAWVEAFNAKGYPLLKPTIQVRRTTSGRWQRFRARKVAQRGRGRRLSTNPYL